MTPEARMQFISVVSQLGEQAYTEGFSRSRYDWNKFSEAAAIAIDTAVVKSRCRGKLTDRVRAEAAVRFWLAAMGQDAP